MNDALEWMRDAKLAGATFGGPSWLPARTLAATIFALPFDEPGMLEIYRECTGRTDPPRRPFREVWVTSGRRSGKSILTAFLAIYTALRRNWREVLAPGEVARIPIYAVDREQAGILFGFCRGLLAESRMCEKKITGETKHRIQFSTGAEIIVGTRDFRSARGATCPLLALEETTMWPANELSANPDLELLRAVSPTQVTVPDALLVSIGSAFVKRGVHYERHAKYEGVENDRVLSWRSTTVRMNPLVPAEEIAEQLADDPDAARAEWLSEERDDIASYVSSDAVRAVCIPDRIDLPSRGYGHACFVDVAAGGACAYTAAIYHMSAQKVVIDKLVVIDPPLNTSHGATKQVADVCKQYGVGVVTGDRFGGDWPQAEFRRHSIGYTVSPLVKTDLFLEALPVILSGACELPDPAASAVGRRLFRELVGCQRRVGVGRTGREEIVKMRGVGDDAANAVCGALALAARAARYRVGTAKVFYG